MSETAKLLIGFSSFLVLAISFLIGLWARRKVTTPEAFFGGAKIFGPLTVGLATMAAVGSAFAVVGVPGLVFSTGNAILLFMFAAPAFVFGYLVIGKKVRALSEIGTVASLGDLSDLRFNHHRGIKLIIYPLGNPAGFDARCSRAPSPRRGGILITVVYPPEFLLVSFGTNSCFSL